MNDSESVSYVLQTAREHDVRFIRLWFSDILGSLKSVAITVGEVLDTGGYFDLTPLDAATDLRRETVLTLEELGIPVEASHHEVAPSQHEIDLRYTDALTMADSTMTYRLAVKEVAIKSGVYASFMPKPLRDENGSGMHVHQSL